MLVSDFDFELPEELIAQTPPETRGSSRMLVVQQGELTDERFVNLPEYLRAGDLLVLNDSRVLPARLYGTRAGLTTQASSPTPSGKIEVLLTQQLGLEEWTALVRPGRKVPVGETLVFADEAGEVQLRAQVTAAGEFGERTLRFESDAEFYAKLDAIGHMPLPPYIHREDAAGDRTRYQTVYARERGSAAAPTAGLHFTPEVLEALRAKGVEIATVTLHVGLGTFQPVRVERVEEIRLHTERYTLSAETAEALNRARREGRRVIAAGTTTTRTLEHCAGLGGEFTEHSFSPHSGETSIFISPGYRFLVVEGLLTNFHLPKSTLLMLVSALGGVDEVRAAYRHAVEQGYRFFSYGDCMLVVGR